MVSLMGRSPARFRISIKDKRTGKALKVELIDAPGLWGERRFRLRQNGKEPELVKEATLTEVFDRLRKWLVKQEP
ncbi:MAG: hypothetical protein HZA31_09970 [Opitutae bacterium]|nr:hypothetical protein [Opitutae bacterium]